MVDYEKLSELREKVELLTKAEDDLDWIGSDVYNCGLEDAAQLIEDALLIIRPKLEKLENELNVEEDKLENSYEAMYA